MKNLKIYIVIILLCTLCGCSKNKSKYDVELDWNIKENYYVSEISQDDAAFYTIDLQNKNKEFNSIIPLIPYKYAFEEDVLGNPRRIIRDENGEYVGGYIMDSNLKRFTINVYDIRTNEKIKTIDAKKLLEENKDIQARSLSGVGTETVNGVPYIEILIEDAPDVKIKGEYHGIGRFYINLDDESYFIKRNTAEDTKDLVIGLEKEDILKRPFLKQNMSDKYVDIYNSNWENLITVYTYVDGLPKNNEKLHTMFPELKTNMDKLSVNNENAMAKFMIPDSLTEEEIMRLFMPDGQELSFDGVIIDAAKSVDGLNHKVYSIEDLKKYMEPREYYKWEYKPILDSGQ